MNGVIDGIWRSQEIDLVQQDPPLWQVRFLPVGDNG